MNSFYFYDIIKVQSLFLERKYIVNTIMEAVQLLEEKQTEKAIQLLENHLTTANDDEKFTIAEVYLQWGFLQESSSILKELIQTYPDESDLKLTLSDIYIELDDDEAAIDLLDEIKEDDAVYEQALLQLADLYQAQGLFEVAEQKLLTAKQVNPNEPVIDFGLAELYFSTGEYRKAIMYYEKIENTMNEMNAVSIKDRLGEAYAAAGEYEKALTYFQQQGEEDPDKLFKYGLTAYQADRSDIAAGAWKHVIELDPYYHTAYFHLAKAYEDEGMDKEGYTTAKKGLEFDAFNKELYFLAGTLAHQIGNNEESEQLVREAIALDPDYKEAVLFLIELFKDNEQLYAITELITEIKNTGADDPLYDWELAQAYNELELYNDALNYYQEAYNGLNQDSDFLKEYGYFLTEEGRTSESIRVFEAYMALVPDDHVTEEFMNRLKSSREI